MNVERWGMSERAQEETKWRLGELARVRVHHGHASAVTAAAAAPTRKWRTTSTFVVQKIDIHRHALTISFSVRTRFFFGDHCVSRRERSLIC